MPFEFEECGADKNWVHIFTQVQKLILSDKFLIVLKRSSPKGQIKSEF